MNRPGTGGSGTGASVPHSSGDDLRLALEHDNNGIPAILEMLKIDISRLSQSGGVMCDPRPGHEERDPSFSVSRGADNVWLWNRFGGDGRGGNVFDLLIEFGYAKSEAAKTLKDRAGLTTDRSTPRAQPIGKAVKAPKAVTSRNILRLHSARERAAKCTTLPTNFTARGFTAQMVADYCLGIEKDGAILFGLMRGQKLIQVKRRNPNGTKQRYQYLEPGHGSPAWLSLDFDDVSKSVLIVEGELNAVAAHAALDSLFATQGVAGASNHPYLENLSGREVFIYADGDDAGIEAAKKWAALARKKGARVVKILEPLPEPLDFCDVLGSEDGVNKLGVWLKNAMDVNEVTKPNGKTINAVDLMRHEFPAPKQAVPGFIPEGLTLIAGSPKLGKSWFVLGIGIAVASGGLAFGTIVVEQGAVLYLALEDSHRRLQSRLEQVLRDDAAPVALEFRTDLPRLDDGGIIEIKAWLETHPNARLIIIDTLARVKPRALKNSQVYDADTEAFAPLHHMALEHGVAVLVVHHTRKAKDDDIFNTISSSTGLTGIADAMLVLQRVRGEATATLNVTGRDLEEKEVAMQFDPETALWKILGDAKQYETITPERKAILGVLTTPLAPIEIARLLNRDSSSTRKLIFGMKNAGLVHRGKDGKYSRGALQALPLVPDGTETPSKSSSTQETPRRYPDTAKKQEGLLEATPTNAVTAVTPWENNVPDINKSVTPSEVMPGNAQPIPQLPKKPSVGLTKGEL